MSRRLSQPHPPLVREPRLLLLLFFVVPDEFATNQDFSEGRCGDHADILDYVSNSSASSSDLFLEFAFFFVRHDTMVWSKAGPGTRNLR